MNWFPPRGRCIFVSAMKNILFLLASLFYLQAAAQRLPEKDPGNPDVYIVAETMPSFEGGESALFAYIAKNIRYPETEVQGKVYVSFVIDRKGKVRDAIVFKGVGKELDAEALRVVRAMPLWKPGMQDGAPVNVKMTLPIVFSRH